MSPETTLSAIVAMGWLCRSSDRRNERRRHSALASIVGAIALAVAGLYPNQLGIALPAITLSTAMLWAAYTVLWALPAGYLGSAAAAGGIAFINVCGALGGFASPGEGSTPSVFQVPPDDLDHVELGAIGR